MKLIVVTKRKDLHTWFSEGSQYFDSVEFLRPNQLNTLKGDDDFLAYIHFPELSEIQQEQWRDQPEFPRGEFGFIDLEDRITDPVSLIHKGYVDVIRKLDLKYNSKQRMARVLQYLNMEPAEQTAGSYDWSSYIEGREYPFLFFYIELDHSEELKTKLGVTRFNYICDYFIQALEAWIHRENGRIWMERKTSALVLFPLVNNQTHVVIESIRFFMNNKLDQVGQFSSSLTLNFHALLDQTHTEYRPPGSTGGLVSDSLNTYFHLTHWYNEAETFYITSRIHDTLSDKIKKYFLPVAKKMEGPKIYRLRHRIIRG